MNKEIKNNYSLLPSKLRKKNYKNYRLQGISRYASAIKAGYSETYAKSRNLDKHGIDIKLALEIAGVTSRKLANKINDGIDAKDENGRAQLAIAHRYLETALKVRGDLTERPQTQIDKMQVVIHLPEQKRIDENAI